MKTLYTLFGIGILANLVLYFKTLKRQNKMESSNNARFEKAQADLNKTNTALNNVRSEMDAQKTKIADLESQIGEMGLTKEQEDVIFAGLTGIREHSENLSTVDENAPTEPTEEEPTEEPAPTEEPTEGSEEENA